MKNERFILFSGENIYCFQLLPETRNLALELETWPSRRTDKENYTPDIIKPERILILQVYLKPGRMCLFRVNLKPRRSFKLQVYLKSGRMCILQVYLRSGRMCILQVYLKPGRMCILRVYWKPEECVYSGYT